MEHVGKTLDKYLSAFNKDQAPVYSKLLTG